MSRRQTGSVQLAAEATEPELGSTTDTPSGLRTPRQDRSRASLERVLTAGAELLVERGYDAFTITEVGRRARASTGLIYTRFENKAALFEAILLREQERMVAAESAQFEALRSNDLGTAELIERLVHDLANSVRREAQLTKVFMERTTVEPELLEHVKRMRTAPKLFAGLLLDRRHDLTHPDPERAADMAFWMANSALERRVHTPMWRYWDPEAADDWDEFVDDLSYALKAFLLGSNQTPTS